MGDPSIKLKVSHTEFEWHSHAATCSRCKAVNLERPATLAQACLTGVELAKRAAAVIERRKARPAP